MPPLRLVFMGTPETAVPSLCALRAAGHEIKAVYCQPPKPSGRKKAIKKSPVHIEAEKTGIPVRMPMTLRSHEERVFIEGTHPDAIVVVAYGLILPREILAIPRLGCFNVHFSLLPRWRGAAPVQHALLAGDKETGVCVMQMDEGLDTGDILLCERVPITSKATAGTLLHELAGIGARLVNDALKGRDDGTLSPLPQPSDGITFAPRLSRDDGLIDWRKPAAAIERQVRALEPWPGTFFTFGGERIKVTQAQVIPGSSGKPGELLDQLFTIACGEQALRIVKAKRPGKNETDGASLLRGLRLPIGHVFPCPDGN